MATIKVPKPPKSAFDKGRPVSSLLRSQLEHLQRAEFRLPADLQTNIYINAIKTEGEAADYIGQVTARLHAAHAGKGAPKAKGGIALAAAAEKAAQKRKSARKPPATGRAKTKTRTKAKSGSKRKR